MLAGVCRRLSSFVTLPAGGRAGRRARGQSGGRYCTVGQYGYDPLGRHLVLNGLMNKTHTVSNNFKYCEIEPCGDVILSAAARRVIVTGDGGGAPEDFYRQRRQ